MALWRLARSRHPLAPWLAAIIIGRGVLLLVSFPTHAPDLRFWVALGVGFGLGEGEDFQGLADHESLNTPAIAAFGVFGFSLSAAWPGGLLLWLFAALPLAALLYALSPARLFARWSLRILILALLILPAILLNQRIGPAAQLAWMWLLLWLAALAISLPWPKTDWSARILKFAIVALLLLLVTLPRLGDIAYKSSLLALDGTQSGDYRRDQYFVKALYLAPYDHVMRSGMAWVMARRLQPDADSYNERAYRIVRMYLGAMADQPSAPEPPAALARWLAHLAERDPQFADQAQDAFDRALTLSPNDIQTLNDQALFWASQGRTDEAIAELNRLLALDPLYGPTYRNLARVYQQMGDEDAARAIIEQGRAHVPWWDGLQ
jgi:tetratricopeptide (TPR) repeat protein